MTLDEIIRRRHSVRAYDLERPIPEEHIAAMCDAARLAPSANNTQTWRFIAVTDRDLLARIATEGMQLRGLNRFLRQTPLLIAGCSQLSLVTDRVFGRLVGTDYYQIDLGIALEHLVLKATELGIGTCWVGWFNEANVKRILGVPEGVRVHAMIAAGYPKAPAAADALHKRKPLDKVLFWNGWRKTDAEE